MRIRLFVAYMGIVIVLGTRAETIIRGPYLQLSSPHSMSVRWRTDTAHAGTVFFGTASTNLDQSIQETQSTVEHEVALTGLQPHTAYYYSINSETNILATGNDYQFETFPIAGTKESYRIWVLGDPGTGSPAAQSVYTAYQGFNGAQHTDLLLTLGDNAYPDGTDIEYQNGFFDMYPEILRQTPVFPSIGNHDGRSSTSTNQSGPYFDIFSLPTASECGGVASGTEAYYSFDFGNIHFICLDSEGSDRSTNGTMYAWTEQDLASCTSQWIIAFFHHPPYAKGTHSSDGEVRMIEMRENFAPLFEDNGMDLVLVGHSHAYERTYLMNGHYGSSSTFEIDIHALNQDAGQEGIDGVYMKPNKIKEANAGAVYVVAGASGYAAPTLMTDHPAMRTVLTGLGSVVLDVVSNRLDLAYLNSSGSTVDFFSILKGDIDNDEDGMSDLWEQNVFRRNVLAEENPDADSHSNLQEYYAGTNPNNASSIFVIHGTNDSAGFILQWSSVSNRSYNIKWTDSLTNGFATIQTNIFYPQNSYTDSVHILNDSVFYSIEAQLK